MAAKAPASRTPGDKYKITPHAWNQGDAGKALGDADYEAMHNPASMRKAGIPSTWYRDVPHLRLQDHRDRHDLLLRQHRDGPPPDAAGHEEVSALLHDQPGDRRRLARGPVPVRWPGRHVCGLRTRLWQTGGMTPRP